MIKDPTPESFLDGAGNDVPCYQIVGVAADIAERSLLPEARLTLQWYTTFEQMPPLPPMMAGGAQIQAVLVKADGETAAVTAAVQRAMQGASPHIAWVEVRPYRDLIDPGARSWQLGATLFTAFGGLALIIAAVGIYGVFACTATQRRREMAVRMALGARPGDVARLVLAGALRSVGYGIVLGGAIALWAARYIEDLLYGTGTFNVGVLIGVAVLLTAVALAASIVPTLRAAHTDPRVTLAAD
jgi:ABC-type antimicrobial peptide transport system permease subunit